MTVEVRCSEVIENKTVSVNVTEQMESANEAKLLEMKKSRQCIFGGKATERDRSKDISQCLAPGNNVFRKNITTKIRFSQKDYPGTTWLSSEIA